MFPWVPQGTSRVQADGERQQSSVLPDVVSNYVDDLILVVDLLKDLQKMKAELSARFWMKDLGQLRYCLGIVCEVSEGQSCINQRPYIDNLVRRFCLSDACGVSTPADACVKLVADVGVSRPADPKLYQQIVGSLQYAAGGTRPDIAYAVSTIANSAPTNGAEVPQTNERPQLDICQVFA